MAQDTFWMGLRDEEIRLHVDTVNVDDQLLIDETEKATNAKTARDLKFAETALEKMKVQSLALAATTAVDAAVS